jgi:rSAM/selenodomain-associated transferase 2
MISVVIPALNEEKALPGTLAALHRQAGRFETIVVDGGSTDRTRELACSVPGVRVISAPRGRASQMNAGAKVAAGTWLLFLHADTQLPDGVLAQIESLDASVQAGGFPHRFAGDDWRLRLVSWIDNFRCKRTGVFYGDQALFVRRDLFWRLGGFPPVSMLEDVRFGETLARATRPLLMPQPVVTDPRKFLGMGVFRSLGRCLLILACHQLRLPIPARVFFSDVR